MLDPYALGAALYVPATHPALSEIITGQKLLHVRTIIICLEDAVADRDLGAALANLQRGLRSQVRAVSRHLFVRVRNPQIMREVLAMPGVESLNGFVLPKITADNLSKYLRQLPDGMQVMPTIETREAFCDRKMDALCRKLEAGASRERVLALRIGGNDLLALLRMRRPVGATIYDTPVGHVIARLSTRFIPHGFALSAPVFEYMNDFATLEREITADLNHGLVGKTAIHPDQVPIIERCYRVSPHDAHDAARILDDNAPGVFASRGAMCEPATHRPWAAAVLRNARHYGQAETRTGTN